MSNMADADLISAAGGVLLRELGGKVQVLLIYRRRYDDWTLPKGKLEAGESPQQAALREVREETGYEVTLGDALSPIRYLVNGRPKLVHFWKMHPQGRSLGIEDHGEVAEAVWLSPEEALERMSYPLERQVLSQALSGAAG
jgi:8-oxo-dGTP pyrophosphatase MutT (NUDIX family)